MLLVMARSTFQLLWDCSTTWFHLAGGLGIHYQWFGETHWNRIGACTLIAVVYTVEYTALHWLDGQPHLPSYGICVLMLPKGQGSPFPYLVWLGWLTITTVTIHPLYLLSIPTFPYSVSYSHLHQRLPWNLRCKTILLGLRRNGLGPAQYMYFWHTNGLGATYHQCCKCEPSKTFFQFGSWILIGFLFTLVFTNSTSLLGKCPVAPESEMACLTMT